MTQKNKLIVGAVVVLGAYYLYTKNKAKSEVADLKDGADEPVLQGGDRRTLETIRPMTSIPLVATELRADSIQVAEGGNKFSNFAGKRGNSYFETIF
jgi:hypothetical protein